MSNASIERPALRPASEALPRVVQQGSRPGGVPVLLTPPSQASGDARRLTWVDRPEDELREAQAAAAQAWLDAVRDVERVDEPLSREQQVELSRQVEALECVAQAVQRHVASGRPVSGSGPAYRVVVAHRLDWFATRITDAVRQHGAVVISQLDDGAEALGIAIAEQPDLLVLQDAMVRLSAEAVLAEVHRFASRTVVAVQVEGPERAQALQELGAHAPFARNLPPAQVASCLLDVLAAARHRTPGVGENRVRLG